MKRVLTKSILAILGLAFSLSAHAADTHKCKVTTHDIGTIHGRGATKEAAFEDAAIQCFERHQQRHTMRRSASLDEDTGLTIIDVCANIKCS